MPTPLASALLPKQAPRQVSHTPRQVSSVIIRAKICAYSLKYGLDPAIGMAVAHIESRKGSQEFRVGRMGPTYYGPMGLHKCFVDRGAADLDRNIEMGVKALTRYPTDLKRSLRRYNTSFDGSYWTAIQRAAAKYRRAGVSE